MCGRFAFQASAQDLARYFSVEVNEDPPARFNIAPSQPVPVVRLNREDDRVYSEIRWGLIPFWAKDQKIGNRTINARLESVAEKPSFREPFRRRRCLILSSGFYEWRKLEDRKLPYFIGREDGLPIAFAGLWDRWRGEEASIDSCAIVTRDADAAVSHIHHRMPVILPDQGQAEWLQRDSPPANLLQLCGEAPPTLTSWPISTRVNKPDNDDPELLEPVELPL